MYAAIIVTHGSLGRTLMESVVAILGPQTDVHVVSNEGVSLEEIVRRVGTILTDQPTAVFVDFCGGSPYIACQTLKQTHPSCAILSGVNLPMLFSFFTKRDKLSFAELMKVAETDGHRGIQLSAS
ncbi:hypothetical protein KKH27_00980 [bacterium]|nr:hypothetical protein [bacterium]MBU1985566.1 hypothetical protein [bacterium]